MTQPLAAVVQATKTATRRVVKKKLNELTEATIQKQSRDIAQRVSQLESYRNSKNVSVYLSMEKEVRTLPLLETLFQDGKSIYVPKVVGSEAADMKMLRVYTLAEIETFPKSKWLIPEPSENYEQVPRPEATEAGDIDLVILPGVAFDRYCNRLGHGKGFYDSFCERIVTANAAKGRGRPKFVGLALEEQIIDEIATQPHDYPLDAVVTPSAVFTPRS